MRRRASWPLIIAALIAAALTVLALTGWAGCAADGGTYVRTPVWFACVGGAS